MLAVLCALILRRRAEVDPVTSQKRARRQSLLRKISGAKTLSARESAEQVADALRQAIAELQPGENRQEIEAIVAEC